MTERQPLRAQGADDRAGDTRLPNPRQLAIVSVLAMLVMVATVIASIIYSIGTIDRASVQSEVARAERALEVMGPQTPSPLLAERLTRDFSLRGAHFVNFGAITTGEAAVAVPGHDGMVLAWSPRKFASEMAADLTPIRLAACLAFLVGVSFILRRLYLVATELDQRRREAQELAVRDALTGLGNRLAFEQQLAECGKSGAALLYLDLDQFKQVNDRLGHGGGDELLRTVGERLRRIAGATDLVARLGGDEFALLRPVAATRGDLAELAADIAAALAEPVKIGKVEVLTGASIGIAILAEGSGDTAGLVAAADAALYRAKALPGHAFVIADDPDFARAA